MTMALREPARLAPRRKTRGHRRTRSRGVAGHRSATRIPA